MKAIETTKSSGPVFYPGRKLQDETVAEIDKVPVGTVNGDSVLIGMKYGEPLLLGIDGLLRYAKAYAKRYESKLAEDGVLGPIWLQTAMGYRGLLNGDGVVAMEIGRTTDSKDNGVIEGVFWAAMAAAGFTEADMTGAQESAVVA